MLVFGEFGIMLGCTLGGVRGDCNGDRIRLRASRTGGELRGGRDATCLGEVSAAKRGVHWLRWWPHKIHRGGH